MNIPEEVKSRLPLMKSEYMELFNKLKEHPHSPIWNYTCGDRINAEDAKTIDSFTEKLQRERKKGREHL